MAPAGEEEAGAVVSIAEGTAPQPHSSAKLPVTVNTPGDRERPFRGADSHMSHMDLSRVNQERRRRGLKAITYAQAQRLAAQHQTSDSGLNITDFLIGYTTGIPMPSAEGIVGAMLHDSSPSSSTDTGSSSSGGGGDFGGGGGSSDL
jgi:hypothetical protein